MPTRRPGKYTRESVAAEAPPAGRARYSGQRPSRREEADASLTTEQKLLARVHDRFDIAEEAEQHDREQALIDDEFKNLEQWDRDIKRDREARDEPCLVIDQINGPIQQIVNSHRNSRPGIKVSARGGGASKKHAEIRQSLCRQIEHDSYAAAVYANAFDQAVSGGWGYWRVNVEHVEGHPTDLEIKIDGIQSRYQVRRDPTATKPTKEDARWWLIADDIPMSEYREEYPDSAVAGLDDMSGLGDEMKTWISEETVRVVEVWERRKKKRRTFQTEDGKVRQTDDLDEKTVTGANYRAKPRSRTTIPVTTHRDVDTSVVMWAKVNGIEILEGNDGLTDAREWQGKYIPIVEMTGEQVLVGNRVHRRGAIRRMRDGQVMLNVQVSDLVVTQARAPKHVWSGFIGQFGTGPEDQNYKQWAMANSGRLAMVQAVPIKGPDGNLLPAPTLTSYTPQIADKVTGIQLATEFTRQTSGYFGAAQGDISPDRSGKAIQNLVRQSEQSSSHYSFNFETALSYTGRIIVDLAQYVYDRPGRQVYIMGPNNEEDSILVKQLYMPTADGNPLPLDPMKDPEALTKGTFIDFSIGNFAVSVTAGRNYVTMQEEKTDALQAIGSAGTGQLMTVVAPDIVEAIGFPGASDLAERLDAANPPEMRRKKTGEQAPSREVQQQLTQSQQIIQQLTEHVKALTLEQQAKSAELASNEKIAAQNNAVKMAIEEMKAENARQAAAMQMQQTAAQAQYDALQARIEAQEQMAIQREQMIIQGIQQQQAVEAKAQAGANGVGA